MELFVATVNQSSVSVPWIQAVLLFVFGMVVLWTGVQTWRGRGRGYRKRTGVEDQRPLRIVASAFPSACGLLSLSFMSAVGPLTVSKNELLVVSSRILFIFFALVALLGVAMIAYIWLVKVPSFLIPPSRRI